MDGNDRLDIQAEPLYVPVEASMRVVRACGGWVVEIRFDHDLLRGQIGDQYAFDMSERMDIGDVHRTRSIIDPVVLADRFVLVALGELADRKAPEGRQKRNPARRDLCQ